MPETRRKTAALLKRLSAELAQETTNLVFQRHPELEGKYGPAGKGKCLEDTKYHLSYLIEAVGADSKVLFSDYVLWAQQVLATRNLPVQDLHAHLVVLKEAIARILPIDMFVRVASHLNHALQLLEEKHQLEPHQQETLEPLALQYLDFLLTGKRKDATELVMREVENGRPVKELYLQVFQPAQHRIGVLWQTNKISVAQEHFCTAVTQSIMSQLYPYVFGSERNGYKLLATCVTGDLHEMGLRMVSDFFEMEGWDTYYLGANMPLPSIVSAIKDQRPDLLLLSATMTYHVPAVVEVIKAIRASQEMRDLKVMVGGYPFNIAEELWKEVGADAYSRNAQEAIVKAQQFVRVKM
ncbi:MAG: cobalamin-dependent protein [Rufibacter sp.]